MSKGGWLIVIAVGGLSSAQAATYVVNYNGVDLVCDASGCRKPSAKDYDYAPDAQRADDGAAEERDKPPTVEDTAITYSPSSGPPSGEEEKREKDDLKAQQDMARWAFWMFMATVAGVGLIGWTLDETRKAARFAADTLDEAIKTTIAANRNITETTRLGTLQLEEARRATAAAEKSVAETRRIGEAQTRAYLSLQKIEFEIVEDDARRDSVTGERKVQTINLIFSLYNSGQSPAREVRIEATAFAEMYQSPQNPEIKRHAMAIFPHRIGDVPAALAHVQVIDARNLIVTNRMRPLADEHWRIMAFKTAGQIVAADVFGDAIVIPFRAKLIFPQRLKPGRHAAEFGAIQ